MKVREKYFSFMVTILFSVVNLGVGSESKIKSIFIHLFLNSIFNFFFAGDFRKGFIEHFLFFLSILIVLINFLSISPLITESGILVNQTLINSLKYGGLLLLMHTFDIFDTN